MRRITMTETECQVVTESRKMIFLKYEDYPELLEAYEEILEVVKQHRTPDQLKADELTAFAIQADPVGAVDLIPDWVEWTEYRTGEYLVYDGKIYRVVQSHRSQNDWLPDEVPALYTLANKTSTDPENPDDDGEFPEWIAPTGGHDAYNTGDKVMFEGKAYESTMDGNTWSPTDYPQGWKELE